MLLAVEIIGIITMASFIIIGVGCFIILGKLYNQLKYSNYLMEKLNHRIFMGATCLMKNKESNNYENNNGRNEVQKLKGKAYIVKDNIKLKNKNLIKENNKKEAPNF